MTLNNLELFQIPNFPNDGYYLPNYISESEEKLYLSKVYSAPKSAWKTLSNRRLQNWGGEPHPKMMIAEPLPSWVQDICSKLTQDNIFDDGQAPNHILVNEYTSGQGIMPHFDGPIYAPTIATISLQSHTVLNFYDPLATEDNEENIKPLKERLKFGILVEPRSLLVLKKDLYEKYLHGIEEVESDVLNEKVLRLSQDARLMKDNSVLERKTRISLTVRQVKKRSKMMLKLGR